MRRLPHLRPFPPIGLTALLVPFIHPPLFRSSPPSALRRPPFGSLFLILNTPPLLFRAHSLPDPNLIQHALTRLARLEHRLGEIIIPPECDQCLDLNLKCDGNGRTPCTWCIKRHSGGALQAPTGQQEAALNLPPLPTIPHHHGAPGSASAGAPPCTYLNHAEQTQRMGLHRYCTIFLKP